MSRKMLINALDPEESRIAVIQEGLLEEFYIERTSRETLVGNVYKGRVANILPSLRAAFVDIGLKGKNGFLHASDVVGSLDRNGSSANIDEEALEDAADRKGREEPPIQKLLTVGQEVLVQVSRDGMGEKGPSLTMDISLPGRYLVITPRVRRVAVSKRIVDPAERDGLRKLLEELDPPKNLGFIIRTAGAEKSVRDLKRDLDYLLRLWKAVVVRAQNTRAPAPVFQESDLVIRTIRDIFTTDIDEIIIDSFPVYNRTLEFFQAAMPRYQDHVKFYRDPEPLFYKYDVEKQIDLIYQRVVPLPSGGSIVIDQTEALTAIDVNSGRFTRTNSPEEMAFRINTEAAEEVVRQLRLRDLGGQIIIDFIDLREEKNRASVERVLRDAAKKDRSQTTILRMSRLGLVEMARQKVRPGVRVISYETCWQCQGTGFTKNVESMSLQVLRQLRQVLGAKEAAFVELKVHPEIANYLQNVKRRDLVALEDRHRKTVLIRGVSSFRVSDVEFQCQDDARQPVKTESATGASPGTAGNEARRRESELRRSILAAAQESRLAAGIGGAEETPAGEALAGGESAARPVGETAPDATPTLPPDVAARATPAPATLPSAPAPLPLPPRPGMPPRKEAPTPVPGPAAGRPIPGRPEPTLRPGSPGRMEPAPRLVPPGRMSTPARPESPPRPVAPPRPTPTRTEGPLRAEVANRGDAGSPGTGQPPTPTDGAAGAAATPSAAAPKPRRTYGSLMHPVSRSGMAARPPAKPAAAVPPRRPAGTAVPGDGTGAPADPPAPATSSETGEVRAEPQIPSEPAPAATAPAESAPRPSDSTTDESSTVTAPAAAGTEPSAPAEPASSARKTARTSRKGSTRRTSTKAAVADATGSEPSADSAGAGESPAPKRASTKRKSTATSRKRKSSGGTAGA